MYCEALIVKSDGRVVTVAPTGWNWGTAEKAVDGIFCLTELTDDDFNYIFLGSSIQYLSFPYRCTYEVGDEYFVKEKFIVPKALRFSGAEIVTADLTEDKGIPVEIKTQSEPIKEKTG